MSFWRSLQLRLDGGDPSDNESSMEEDMLTSAFLRGFTATRATRTAPTTLPPAVATNWVPITNHRSLFQPSTIHHWQLRHLLRPIRNSDGAEFLVMIHQKDVFAVQPSEPTEGRRCAKRSLASADFDPICVDANHGYLALGGSEGQLQVFRLDPLCSRTEELCKADVCTSAVNSVQICQLADQSIALVLTSNDHEVTVLSLPSMQVRYTKLFETALNYAVVNPIGNQMVVVGDCFDAYLLGMGDKLEQLGVYRQSSDFGFCAAWHKNSCTFAAGSQDGVVNVWDSRVAMPEAMLGGKQQCLAQFSSVQASHAGAIRSISFTSCPLRNIDLMVFAEQSNRFSMIDSRSFSDRYEVDICKYALPRGFDYNIDIAGTAFSPDHSQFYVAVKSKLHIWDVNFQCRRSMAAFDIR